MDTSIEPKKADLFIYYIGGYLFISAVLFYFGTIISKDIENPVSYGLFWVIYIITFITLGNSVFNYYSYVSLGSKDGIRGNEGYPGIEGDKGDDAECDKDCKLKSFSLVILNKLNIEYNKILQVARKRAIEPPRQIKNAYIIDTVKRICDSKQFKQVSQLKHPSKLLDYIGETFSKWIRIIAVADLSEGKKHFQDYMEIYGEQREWEALIKAENNPFHEIEKYDIYYWGLDKEFHPIKLKSCLKTKKEEVIKKPIKAVKTNLYNRTHYDKGTGSKFDLALWRSEPLKIKDEMYYPLGEVSTCVWDPKLNDKYVELLGDKPFKFNVNSSKKMVGPNYSNVLVSGDKDSVRKPPAKAWDWKWNSEKTGGKFRVTMWNAEDFEEDGKLFRCFGGMSMPNWKWNTPTEQLGRDNVPIVCVNDKLLDEVPNKHNFIYDDRKSGGRYDLEVYANLDKDYNLSYFRKGNWRKGIRGPDLTRKMYKLKDEYVKSPVNSSSLSGDELNNMVDEGYAVGFQDVKYENTDNNSDNNSNNKNNTRKGSLFDLLDLVVKSPLQSMFHNQKLFLEHSGLNKPNSYLIKEYDKKTNQPDKCLKINEKGTSYTVSTCNPTQDKQLWEIEFLGQSKEMCLVKSLQNSKYLLSFKPYVYQLTGNLPSRDIKDPKLKPYIWHILSSNT